MAAERGDDETPRSDDAASPRQPSRTVRPNENDLEPNCVPTNGATDRRQAVPLSARIERTRLELQIAALEDALETSERRRQAVIDRYERLLADRATTDDETSSADRSDSVLRRLLER